ncbi:hypothetical protein [uncultured Methanobrevibacter sp.]|uniref:hypothetical protein n=1 Tax=uncultured Methanobrevibacter sp. TaxID=253161 RepID=UPI0025E7815C|nr:hypothetical protein [uncultured Methanobrevibacter sp.]
MRRNNYRLIILLLIAILLIFGIAITLFNNNNNNNTAISKPEVIANNTQDNGSVQVIKNIGNPNSSKKIAYVVGIHPLENDIHKTLLKLLPNTSNLNYSYDIYIVNVTEDFSSYGQLTPDDQPGRQTGQELALKYVYPEISKGNYSLAVDIHGHGAYYPVETFVFTPVDNQLSSNYSHKVSNSTQNISYYDPQHTTSGPYLTVPLNEKGIPAFYYEENCYLAQNIKDLHMLELIHAIDNLKLQ